MNATLASAIAAGKLRSFDVRSAYLFVNGFYVNVLTVVRASTLSLEQSSAAQGQVREKWQKSAAPNFVIEFRPLEFDSEGARRMKLILAEVEEWEATDRLRTEDIDEFDFEARDIVKALSQKYDCMTLDSNFDWPGIEDKGSLAAMHIPYRPASILPQVRAIADIQVFHKRVTDSILEATGAALGLKRFDKSLELGAYIGLPLSG